MATSAPLPGRFHQREHFNGNLLNERLSADLNTYALQVIGEERMKFDTNAVAVEYFARFAHIAVALIDSSFLHQHRSKHSLFT